MTDAPPRGSRSPTARSAAGCCGPPGWPRELLTSFTTEVGEVALRPGTGGVFRIAIDGDTVWDRKVDGSFPEVGRLKRLVRDRVAPERSLGHTDRAADASAPGTE